MRLSRIVVLVVAVVIIAIAGLYAFAALLGPKPGNSPWKAAAEYPIQLGGTFGVAGQQCVNSTLYVYCVGGEDVNGGPRNDVYASSSISSSSNNISVWTQGSNAYPRIIHGQACVVYYGYVYCVGGTYDANGDDVSSSYYAPLSSNGAVGRWNSTTAYPTPIDSQYCVASSGYIYCVGGNSEIDGTNADSTPSNSVWYASLSASGIGSWSPSTAYPGNIYFPSCFAAGGYIYCLGGADSSNKAQSAVYYAPLTFKGVGAWTQTTAYPLSASGQACAISSGYIYCVGGEEQKNSYTNAVYYTTVSSGGMGAWKQAASYPLSVGTTCVISSGYLYCVGGFDSSSAGEKGATYYVALNSLSGGTASS